MLALDKKWMKVEGINVSSLVIDKYKILTRLETLSNKTYFLDLHVH